mgnify:FL=1
MSDETFGQRLRRYRTTKGFSQRLLAHNAGVDHTYLSKIENGKTDPPSYRTVKTLARCLDLDTVDLAILAGPRAALTARVHQLEEELLKARESLQEALAAADCWQKRCP